MGCLEFLTFVFNDMIYGRCVLFAHVNHLFLCNAFFLTFLRSICKAYPDPVDTENTIASR